MTTLLSDYKVTLDDLVADLTLEEFWINGPNQVFVAEGGVSRAVPMDLTALQIGAFVERALRHTGRRVDVFRLSLREKVHDLEHRCRAR